MEWYTLYDQLVPVIGDRAISLFSHAISEGNECLICSIFFRKILIDSGDDPDNPHLSDTEKLLVDFGGAICKIRTTYPTRYTISFPSVFQLRR